MTIKKKHLNIYSVAVTMMFTVLVTWNLATYNMHDNHAALICPIDTVVADISNIIPEPVIVATVEKEVPTGPEVIPTKNETKVTSVTFNRHTDDIPTMDELDIIGHPHGVPGRVLMGMGLKESHLDNTVVSPVGAKGMFQILDNTARFLEVANVRDNFEAADGAARYLNHLHKRLFKVPFTEHTDYTLKITLGAYNAGASKLRRVAGGYELPNYRETREYASDILGYYKGTKYYVKKGDTVRRIADKHDIKLAALLLINGNRLNDLKYGIFIRIDAGSYVVEKGDTLYSIATKFGSTVDELKRINSIDDINVIGVDTVLTIG